MLLRRLDVSVFRHPLAGALADAAGHATCSADRLSGERPDPLPLQTGAV